jgi:hypothetical protein
MNSYVRWFCPAVIIGVVINILGMALPFIVAPNWYLTVFSLPGGGGSPVWMRQAGILLFSISLLYVPGGIDPVRYSINARAAVVVRLAIGLYWLWLVFFNSQSRSFLLIGIFDVSYAILLGVLLRLVLREEERYAGRLSRSS